MKQVCLLAVGSALLCGGSLVEASLIPPSLWVDEPGLVRMVDGQDPDTSVAFKITERNPYSGLDFGFMTGDIFSPLGSGWRQKQNPAFAGGSTVDFAVRSMGADKQFGTSDDQIYRLSDPGHYANQYYSGQISPWKSIRSEQDGIYYRTLTMIWDLDHDGIRDLKITLQTRSAIDGFQFVAPATPVPLPAAVWLLGAGLAGLTGLGWRRGAKPSA